MCCTVREYLKKSPHFSCVLMMSEVYICKEGRKEGRGKEGKNEGRKGKEKGSSETEREGRNYILRIVSLCSMCFYISIVLT